MFYARSALISLMSFASVIMTGCSENSNLDFNQFSNAVQTFNNSVNGTPVSPAEAGHASIRRAQAEQAVQDETAQRYRERQRQAYIYDQEQRRSAQQASVDNELARLQRQRAADEAFRADYLRRQASTPRCKLREVACSRADAGCAEYQALPWCPGEWD